MATQSVAESNQAFMESQEAEDLANASWRPSNRNEAARDIADKKLYQAEMLAHSIYGDGFEAFKRHNDRIQDGVLWALADLITDAREALEETEQK